MANSNLEYKQQKKRIFGQSPKISALHPSANGSVRQFQSETVLPDEDNNR
jgi:hypothetical protein